jgi:5-methylcytosine-specific restriction protein A
VPLAPQQHRPHRTQPREQGKRLINSWRWRKPGGVRQQYLQEHPLCVMCKAKGWVVPATDVDHKIPHQEREALFWQYDNLQSLCKSCHSRKTATEDNGFGNEA